MTSDISKDILIEVIHDLLFDSSGVINQYMTSFTLENLEGRSRESALGILIAISGGKNKQVSIVKALKAKHPDVSKLLVKLLEIGIISKHGACYLVEDPMLGYWLRSVYQRKRDLLINGGIDRAAIFKNDIKEYIDGYGVEFSKGIIDRISDLFHLFSNDLVILDSKSMRLPHFTKIDVRQSVCARAFVLASFRGSSWVVVPFSTEVTENDVVTFVKDIKALNIKTAAKVILPLAGIEDNAKLLAKELRINLWDLATTNKLMSLYDRKRMIL